MVAMKAVGEGIGEGIPTSIKTMLDYFHVISDEINVGFRI
jgi:hypothetical protein